MGFFFDRLKRGKGNISPDADFTITESGKSQLSEYGGDPKSRILLALETGGTGNVDKISSSSGLTKGEVERLLPILLRNRYVRFVTAPAVGDDL